MTRLRNERGGFGANDSAVPRLALAAAGIALLLSIAALALRSTGGSAPASVTPEGGGAAVGRLDRETGERERLAAEVRELRARLDRLEWQMAAAPAPGAPEGPAPDGEIAESTVEEASNPPTQRPAFDRGRLVEAGVDEREAERLRALWSEIELTKLHLIDQAEREGWSRHRRYEELRAVQESVRTLLDDDSYDRYLYAAATPNRVVVRDVLDRSPAARAGLRPGDAILSYDGSRVFARDELREATSFAEEGQQVRLEILRGGRALTITAPAGPLGLLLMSQLHEPR